MKLEGGFWTTAVVLGIAATIGVSSTKPPPPSQSARQPTAESPVHPNTPAIDKGLCGEIEKRLQTFFLVGADQVVAPDSCFPGEHPPAQSQALRTRATQLQFVIATLPDPLHTYFPLIFDRSADAIQQAAQDDNFVYDSSWLPWETERPSYAGLDDQDKAEKRQQQREDQPGIFLFRRSVIGTEAHDQPFAGGLAVLIVGEEPTGGIHRRQFENAVQWIAALQTAKADAQRSPLQILGPSFSGSIPSLVELLRSTADTIGPRARPHLRILSGSVTSDAGVRWLNNVARLDDLSSLGIQFYSFKHSGNLDLDRYCRYLAAAGTELAALAIVSEDETAFGGEYGNRLASRSPCRPNEQDETGNPFLNRPARPWRQGPVHLFYPRDISSLRAAYQKQSIFSPTTAQSSGDTSHHTLPADLADPEVKDHDTIRVYSGNQTALSQEAELEQIVSVMRAHKTEYILLRSSNPLDQLFLSHFFRMTYPEGRIVIVGADLLLRRETGAAGLNGVMTLSTYPLLPWGQDWTRAPDPGGLRFHSHRVFAYDGAEGTYSATRFLLFGPGTTPATKAANDGPTSATSVANGEVSDYSSFVPPNCISELNLPDYSLPFWMEGSKDPCHHPPTWLSVLGNGGFWPVAVLDYSTDLGSKNPQAIAALGEHETHSRQLQRSVTSIGQSVAFLFVGDAKYASAGGTPQAWPGMPLSMKFLMLAVLAWAIHHAFCCCRASLTVKPAHRAHFVRPNCSPGCDQKYVTRHQYSHRALIVLGSVLVVFLPIILAWGYGEMWEGGEPLPNPWAYRIFLPITWFIAAFAVCANALVENRLLNANGEDPDKPALSKSIAPLSAVWPSFLWFTGLSLMLYWSLEFWLDIALNRANRLPTYWRAINLTTGVSPLVPLIALVAGLYGWFWYSLQGLALFGEDRPQLPERSSLKITQPNDRGLVKADGDDLLLAMSRNSTGAFIEELCSPFAGWVWVVAGISFAVIAAIAWFVFGYPPIRSLGSNNYSMVFCIWLVLCASLLLANAWQFSRVWLSLSHLLQFLDKLPLRRTLAAFTGFSWGSVWKMSGNVLDVRYKLVFRQFESLTHLRSSLLAWEQNRRSRFPRFTVCKNAVGTVLPSACAWIEIIDGTIDKRLAFARWYSVNCNDWKARSLHELRLVQESLAHTAATMLTELLIPTWREEGESLVLGVTGEGEDGVKHKKVPGAASVAGLPPHIRNAEELVCLVYMGFIQNVLGRMRSLIMSMTWIFISITIAIASYPFDPRPLLSGVVLALFAVVGATIIVVYLQMHRDATLSNLTDTEPGELGSDFWMKLVGVGAGPALGVVASVFPEFTQFLFSWVKPGIASIQ